MEKSLKDPYIFSCITRPRRFGSKYVCTKYKNIPMDSNINKSPSDLHFGHHLNAFLPICVNFKETASSYYVQKHPENRRLKQYFQDLKNRQELPYLGKGEHIYVKDNVNKMIPARIKGTIDKPRSYLLTMPSCKK